MRAAVRCVSPKRFTRAAIILVITLMLSACAASVLVGNAQSRLLWSFLQPLVGFNPHEMNLLESPLIKPRMQALLGSRYDSTVKMLRTANQLQQEGALFFLVSRYAPDSVKNITDKAGFVWNADTNQMAVLLIENGLPRVFSESTNNTIEKAVPQWPRELKTALTDADAWQKSLKERAEEKTTKVVAEKLGLEGLEQPLKEVLKGKSAEDALKDTIEDSSGDLIRQPVIVAPDISVPDGVAPAITTPKVAPATLPATGLEPEAPAVVTPPKAPKKTSSKKTVKGAAARFSQEREDDFLKSLEREEAELLLINTPAPNGQTAE